LRIGDKEVIVASYLFMAYHAVIANINGYLAGIMKTYILCWDAADAQQNFYSFLSTPGLYRGEGISRPVVQNIPTMVMELLNRVVCLAAGCLSVAENSTDAGLKPEIAFPTNATCGEVNVFYT
jgi:hypothetical protein